jgi:hypothetical protein
MESKVFRQQRGYEIDLGLIEATQRLTPEERLNAFLTHNRLMVELYNAGQLPPSLGGVTSKTRLQRCWR